MDDEADTRHSEEWVAELEAHFAAKERELARVRAERDRLAEHLVFDSGLEFEASVAYMLEVAAGPALGSPIGKVAAALAEHDQKAQRRIRMKVEDKVITPRGPGVVWQVFEHRIAVVLDGKPDKVAFFTPEEVEVR